MTIINATILPAFGMMTQDTSMSNVEAFPNVRELAKHCQEDADSGTGPALRDPECSGCKMTAMPDQRLLVGGAGSLLFSVIWRYELKQAGHDIDSLDSLARQRMPELRDQLIEWCPAERAALAETIVLHIGHSPKRGHIIGRLYCAEDGFAGQVIEPEGGHIIQPGEMNPSDPEYQQLYDAWTPAALGEGVEDFHRLLASHQHRCAQAGMYKGTPEGIDQTLDIGRVTPLSASITPG